MPNVSAEPQDTVPGRRRLDLKLEETGARDVPGPTETNREPRHQGFPFLPGNDAKEPETSLDISLVVER